MKNRYNAIVICVLAMALFFTGCSANREPASTPQSESLTTESSSQQVFVPSEIDDMDIETPYGTLHYPEQWSDFIEVSQVETENGVTVHFTANVAEKNFELFSVSIGVEAGTQVGTLVNDEGVAYPVYLQAEGLSGMEGLTEEEQNYLYAMQEELNYLIDCLE